MNARKARPSGRLTAQKALQELPDLLSLLAFFTVTALLFRSLEFALVVTASLGFHELGHAAALSWYRLEWRIAFGWMGAWTWSPLRRRERLTHLQNVIIHLAGPVFSLLLSLIALALHAIWQPPSEHLQVLASFSAQMGFLNLLPLGPMTDGGKIIRRMVDSLGGDLRARAVLLPVVASALIVTAYGLVELPEMGQGRTAPLVLGLLLVGVWLAGSFFIEVHHAGRSGKLSLYPMKAGEVYILLLVVWLLLALSLVVDVSTPFWLRAEYVLGSLENIYDLLEALSRFAMMMNS